MDLVNFYGIDVSFELVERFNEGTELRLPYF